MRWKSAGFVGVVCWVAACATATTLDVGNGPDGSATDAASSSDAAIDNGACPQYDLSNDPEHCGSCTHACASTQVCSNGACKAQCDTPLVQCVTDAGAICSDTTSDKNHCGACTTTCSTADAGGMTPGTNNPDPGLFDGGYDGGIGWNLGTATCEQSKCGVECADAMALCTDEICYDLENHHDHCGDCNTACTDTTQWCNQGHCCGIDTEWCTSTCANVLTDLNNCGSCGHACDGGSCSGGACVACAPNTITGPTLTTNIGGWPNAGIRIKALKNTTLTGFVVNNQGTADTVSLTDTGGTAIQTLSLPASSTAYTASVSWNLTAGTSYDLILANGSNGRWVSFSSFPQTGVGLEVDDTVDTSQNLYTSYWFTFTNLTSCP